MKLMSLYLKNYAAILRASGLDEIYIDFTKCKSNIVLIIGPNGSGKTTILEALSPLPESNSSIIEKREGIKEIKYIDNDIIYQVRIVYPIKYDFTRATIKGFISKIYPNGTVEELNSNGNITSFKERIYEVFGFDPNYESLTKMSMDDRGIVSKTPNERKKFVTNILDSVEVYNNIYKVISKRSSTFKALINSAASKINNIGNEEELRNRLTSISNRISSLTMEKEKLIKLISDNEAIVRVLDPDGSIQEKYNNICTNMNICITELQNLKLVVVHYEYDNIEDCTKAIQALNEDIASIESNINQLKFQNDTMISSMSADSDQLMIKRMKLKSLNIDDNIDIMKGKLKELQETNSLIKSSIPEGFNCDISAKDFANGINIIKSIIEEIDRIKDQEYQAVLETVRSRFIEGINPVDICKDLKLKIELSSSKIRDLQIERSSYEKDLEVSSILSNRPSTCNDDECPFIKNALLAQSKQPEDNIKRIDDEIFDNQMDITINSDSLQEEEDVLRVYNQMNIIFRSIDNNKELLSSLGAYFILERDSILKYLSNSTSFNNELNALYERLEISNQTEIYKMNVNEINILTAKLEAYNDKVSLLKELNNDIDNLTAKVSDYDKKISDNQVKLQELSDKYKEKVIKRDTYESYKVKFARIDELESRIYELKSRSCVLDGDINKIKASIDNINSLNSQLLNINNELDPLSKEKDNISYSLNMLASYQKELEELNLKYEKIETIRKYSSPGKGIQTLYMELYMGKTLRIANELLSMLFDGDLVLMDYIINENEFRIPVRSLSSSIINDDIKSCSSAQRSMISMIIGIALFAQGSGKLDIMRLDEVDSPLDENNRASFIPTVNKMMNAMHISQCIMISHSSESELSNVDIISLRNNYNGPGNLVFQY